MMHHIEICRTPVFDGHVEQCTECGFKQTRDEDPGFEYV